MPTRELLPGVTTVSCPPAVVCDAHREIRKARRRAFARDSVQIVLLVMVDYLFVHWPESRLPFVDRVDSLSVLRLVNAGVIMHLWLARALPKWWARRVASTWCRSEQEKFQRRQLS